MGNTRDPSETAAGEIVAALRDAVLIAGGQPGRCPIVFDEFQKPPVSPKNVRGGYSTPIIEFSCKSLGCNGRMFPQQRHHVRALANGFKRGPNAARKQQPRRCSGSPTGI